ncbi:TetR/AcrR family transcriptional regulator [Lactiplantibacillus plantarum]|uniref:TetR/AcrR family transcriptional regulator n=1 Tax=Lactiplantibacillus plantarum TaxID=1590 RepID=UPI001BACE3E4|nr:helix-turn-helix domain-containing protein [Lactiplantibacillus plantarum]MBS0937744.1 TetR/AcrR family transcriptional regulator [Lactiplantibacillus plantarum]MBS0945746.1 TetR/AcrR family transcriptional regulator [Lactiplantibacillus plantarum]
MTKTRRRGAELEAAIYQATRDILAQDGFTKLTFANVADLAGTSKPVIYRRWNSPLELALTAIQDKIKSDNHGQLDELQLTGRNLSEDLFQIVTRFTVSIDTFNQAFVITWFRNLTDADSEQVQKLLHSVKTIDAHAIDRAIQRAQERGELALGELSMDLKLMPFDWLRYRIFAGESIDEPVLRLLVDDLLVPAYQHALTPTTN